MENNNTNRIPFDIQMDPIDFHASAETAFSTTVDIAKRINDVMKKVFADYYGCVVSVQYVADQYSRFFITPKLVFKVMNDSAYDGSHITGFIPASKIGDDNNILGRIQRVSDMSRGPKVKMTDEMKDVIKKFMIMDPNKIDSRFDWSTMFKESVTHEGAYVEVFKLDITKFLKFIYGSKDKNGGDANYQISPVYQISSVQYGGNDNWSVNIMRLNGSDLAVSAKQIGIMVNPNNGPRVVTDTTTGN